MFALFFCEVMGPPRPHVAIGEWRQLIVLLMNIPSDFVTRCQDAWSVLNCSFESGRCEFMDMRRRVHKLISVSSRHRRQSVMCNFSSSDWLHNSYI